MQRSEDAANHYRHIHGACRALLAANVVLSIEIQATSFGQRIPAADYRKFKSVRDAKDWLNPYLEIRWDGIDVISPAFSTRRKLVPLSGLRETLIQLPNSA